MPVVDASSPVRVLVDADVALAEQPAGVLVPAGSPLAAARGLRCQVDLPGRRP